MFQGCKNVQFWSFVVFLAFCNLAKASTKEEVVEAFESYKFERNFSFSGSSLVEYWVAVLKHFETNDKNLLTKINKVFFLGEFSHGPFEIDYLSIEIAQEEFKVVFEPDDSLYDAFRVLLDEAFPSSWKMRDGSIYIYPWSEQLKED